MLRVHEKLMSGPKMARFQQNIRKVSEKKMGRDTNSPVAANGFCTVSEPNCVRLSWIDHTGAGHTTQRESAVQSVEFRSKIPPPLGMKSSSYLGGGGVFLNG